VSALLRQPGGLESLSVVEERLLADHSASGDRENLRKLIVEAGLRWRPVS
jgi:hypothetical protein